MTNFILWSFQHQSVMAVAILDLSAAFDTIDHELLLAILNEQFGIADTALG